MNKGRLMELTHHNHMCDSALPQDWVDKMRKEMSIAPEFWYVWSYLKNGTYNKPVHLGETLFHRMEETHILVNDDPSTEFTILDLVETLLAHPEEVQITIK